MRSRGWAPFIGLAIAFSVLAGCKEGTISPVLTGGIDGLVLDFATNAPLSGVSITTSPPTDALVTDAEGRFSMPEMEAGNYTVSARRPGYQNTSVTVRVRENRTTEATIFLEEADDDTTATLMAAEITNWWNRTAGDSLFVNVEYRVSNEGTQDINAYELYFRILAGQREFFHEETGEDLRVNQSDIRQFEKYISETPADSVVVDDFWVE